MANFMLAICEEVLNCSKSDVSLLEACEYDLNKIVSELYEEGTLSLQSVVGCVVQNALFELHDLINNKIEIIIDELSTIIPYLPYSDETEDEVNKKLSFIESDSVLCYIDSAYSCEWREEAEARLEKLKNIQKDGCIKDIEYYFNYLDTKVTFLRNQETYKKFFADEIEEIEKKLGLPFGNI